VQAVADEQDTAHRSPLGDPAGVGVGRIAQVLPFHSSARVLVVLPVSVNPAAVQAVADGHDTPFKPEKAVPWGLGVGGMDQEAPVPALAAAPPIKPG
jgi:hypothetical protein